MASNISSHIPSQSNITVDNVNVFYRYAGQPTSPPLLLLHGFPSSSHQYRHLIPLLSDSYYVIAPDFPGFGFTDVPSKLNYTYTFNSLTQTITAFLAALHISRYAVYIFDYGAPVAERLALANSSSVAAIISQNGNAYDAGFGHPFWDPIMAYWKSDSIKDRQFLKDNVLTLEGFKGQYETGVPTSLLPRIQPESYTLDYAQLSVPGRIDAQLDLLLDYRSNPPLYPAVHEYFRKSQVPLLAVWGKGDPAFIPPGAEAFKKDLPNAEIHFLDTGHFALETNSEDIAGYILAFLKRVGYSKGGALVKGS
ncbi:MAG: hypothetical protein M1814_000841 [Vezdaea aestivalis]|nr:MAG: hypothetical protein M1814_000841 [Vezdaea aestivalis]